MLFSYRKQETWIGKTSITKEIFCLSPTEALDLSPGTTSHRKLFKNQLPVWRETLLLLLSLPKIHVHVFIMMSYLTQMKKTKQIKLLTCMHLWINFCIYCRFIIRFRKVYNSLEVSWPFVHKTHSEMRVYYTHTTFYFINNCLWSSILEGQVAL